jgi:hypothetical protein
MKVRSIIGKAPFRPETLKILFRAYDDAWAAVPANFGDDPSVIERARVRLADALLSVASEDIFPDHDVALWRTLRFPRLLPGSVPFGVHCFRKSPVG